LVQPLFDSGFIAAIQPSTVDIFSLENPRAGIADVIRLIAPASTGGFAARRCHRASRAMPSERNAAKHRAAVDPGKHPDRPVLDHIDDRGHSLSFDHIAV